MSLLLISMLSSTASAVAAFVSLVLLFQPSKLPGCGPTSACDAVTSSRWSRLGPVKVALPAFLLYAVFCTATLARGLSYAVPVTEATLLFCIPVVIGSAFWFAVLQMAVIHRLCLHCSLIHIAGTIAAICALLTLPLTLNPLIGGTAGLVFFVILQITIRPRLYRITHTDELDASGSQTPITAQSLSSSLELVSGRVAINRSDWPFFGSAAARYNIAFLFDVTCHDCRKLYKQLLAFAQQNLELGVYAIPVASNPSLNPRIHSTDNYHPDSSDYARIMLAIWHLDAAIYHQYEAWLLAQSSLPSLFEVRSLASRILGATRFMLALSHEGVESRLKRAVQVYTKLDSDRLPQILLPHGAVLGTLSGPELISILRNQDSKANLPALAT